MALEKKNKRKKEEVIEAESLTSKQEALNLIRYFYRSCDEKSDINTYSNCI